MTPPLCGEKAEVSMKSIMDLKNERVARWEQAKAFLEKNRDPKTGLVNAAAVERFNGMVDIICQLADEITRREKMEEMDREIYGGNKVSDAKGMQPAITLDQGGLAGNAFASASYTNAFNNMIRGNGNIMEVRAALSVGVNKEGGYTVSDEFDRKLVKKLNDHNVLRRIANVMQTVSGEHKIPIAASTAEANWVDEAALIPETSPQFDQISLGANKLAALLLATNAFLRDSMIDVENYVADQFAIALGNKEEAAFINGTGVKQPTGLLHDTDGAGIGATAEGVVTFDDVMRLYYSLNSPYRKDAVFLCNEDLLLNLMLLKDGNGNYIWQPSMEVGKPDTILGKPIFCSSFMPVMAAGNKVMLFGDFAYYWVADRGRRTFQRLDELFAVKDCTGFKVTERVDGRLILKDAMKALKVEG